MIVLRWLSIWVETIGRTTITGYGSDLFLRQQTLGGAVDRGIKWQLDGSYSQLPHLFSQIARSPPGIGTLRLADITPAMRITPAGRFEANLGRDLGPRDILWVDYDAAISLHRVVTTNPKEAARRGYVASRDAKGKLVVRQRPGPDNALGQIKLEMPNPYNVYIHDTPSKDLFANQRRAFSHGCIRTQDPHSLAVSVLGPDQEQTVDLLLATGVSRTLRLPAPMPVYVVYMTAEATDDGQVTSYPDIYKRDRP